MLTLALRVPPSGKGAAELGQREQRDRDFAIARKYVVPTTESSEEAQASPFHAAEADWNCDASIGAPQWGPLCQSPRRDSFRFRERPMLNAQTRLSSSLQRSAWSNLAAPSAEQIGLGAGPMFAVLSFHAQADATAWLQTAQTLPFLLLAIPAGLLADRKLRRRLMTIAECFASGSPRLCSHARDGTLFESAHYCRARLHRCLRHRGL
jgi:Transmembrane secretion effector